MAEGKEAESTPGTDKGILSILAYENDAKAPDIRNLMDFRFISRVIDTWLKPKEAHATSIEGFLCNDDRLRCYYMPTTETNRWKSARPNGQNFTKRREKDYKRIMGGTVCLKCGHKEMDQGDPDPSDPTPVRVCQKCGYRQFNYYPFPVCSMFTVSDGCLLVEADYTGAELFWMAVQSGDMAMLDHVMRAQLDEDDPNFYDIHSTIAVKAYRLECAATKKGLKSISKSWLRDVAKQTIFGLAYGRGAKAIALGAKEVGVDMTAEEAQAIIDSVFAEYPLLQPLFEECERLAVTDRCLCTFWRCWRRFPAAQDRKMAGDFGREAKNLPIQGGVAGVVNHAVANLVDLRDRLGRFDLFKLCFQKHDSIGLEVPIPYVRYVTEELLPLAMRELCPVYPTTLKGVPTGKGPFFLGFEAQVYKYWTIQLSAQECGTYGFPQKFHKPGVTVSYGG